jgi:hypothetical protein
MKDLLIILALIGTTTSMLYAQEKEKYSVQEIKSDFQYLYKTLEKSNYNLYAYTEKEKMDSVYKEIEGSITDSLTSLEVFRLFQPFVASVKMSHCFLLYPSKEYFGSYLEQGGTVFPLNLYFSQGKVFVKNNFSENNLISINDEILALNNQPINEFMAELYSNISGPSNYFKASHIEQRLFARIYWYFYGECKAFKLQIKKKNGEESELVLNAIPGKEFEEKNGQQKSNMRHNREFHIYDDNTAYLRPGGFININVPFDPEDPATFDNTEFSQFIDSAFVEFSKKESKNLILDLRYNMGGDNSFSNYLIAYFADKPFSISSKFSMKTSQMTKDFWKEIDIPEHQAVKEQIMSHENGTYFDVFIPKTTPHKESKRFNGEVFALINRYSYSNTSSVAAIIQDYDFGIIIGEETAEEQSSYAAFHFFNLPKTQWPVAYPKAYFIRPNGDSAPRGVVPDYVVHEDIFSDKDEVLEYALKTIADKEKTSNGGHTQGH